MNYFLSLSDKVGAKDHPLAGFNLVKWGATAVTIECLKGCHLDVLLVTIIIQELGQRQPFIPIVAVVHHTCSEHMLKNLIHSTFDHRSADDMSNCGSDESPKSHAIAHRNGQQIRPMG
jgi:hypothetical protein